MTNKIHKKNCTCKRCIREEELAQESENVYLKLVAEEEKYLMTEW